MLTARQATREDVLYIAPRLRRADMREIEAGGGDPVGSLLQGLESPDGCYVGVDDEDHPVLIFGTNPSPDPHLGWVWMMATDAVRKHRRQLLRETRQWVLQIGRKYRVLSNAVHADNTLHIRWVAWAGFTFINRFNFNGQDFLEFALIYPQEDTHV